MAVADDAVALVRELSTLRRQVIARADGELIEIVKRLEAHALAVVDQLDVLWTSGPEGQIDTAKNYRLRSDS